MIAVAHERRQVGRLAQHLGVLGREGRKLPHRGIFAEHHSALRVRENFQRVALPDPQRAADLLRNHHAPQIVDSSHNSRGFHTIPP